MKTWMPALLVCAVLDARAAQLPRVDILYPPYGSILDRNCASIAKNPKATPELIQAAVKLRPALIAQWNDRGTRYLRTALDEIGAPFPYGEMQVALSVCGVGTMSVPLIVDVRQYLPGAERPAPIDDFSEKVFHELMHHYASSLNQQSAMRKKYSSETPVVVNHLHVMALEKFVLIRLGDESELELLDKEYRTEHGAYTRAWEIVNSEGYDRFIQELKAAARAR